MRILLFGKNGQVGWELQRSLAALGELIAVGRQEVNLDDPAGLRRCIRQYQPDTIVNAAAYTAVDTAEAEPEKAHRVNAQAAGILAEEAHRLKAWLVHYSTDYVFDGEKPSPYEESDGPNPLSVYGRTKLEGEKLIQTLHARHLILRTGWVYAARGDNFARTMLRLASEKSELKVVADQHGAPTSAELIADVTALALYRIWRTPRSNALAGTYHLAAGGETTWHGYAQYLLEIAQAKNAALRIRAEDVKPIPTEAYPLPAKRPRNSRLNTAKLSGTFNIVVPHWRYHVQRYMDEIIPPR